MKSFIPKDYQKKLDLKELVKKYEKTEDELEFDFLIVGAGPSGLSAALEMAYLNEKAKKEGKIKEDLKIAVLEKSSELGGHSLSGAILNPISLKALLRDEDSFPFEKKVKKESFYFLTEKKAFPIPSPPTLKNKNFYYISLCKLVRFLGKKAEKKGVFIFCGFSVKNLVYENDEIIGVQTLESGLNEKGEKKSSYQKGLTIKAKVSLLAEGVRGNLTEAYQMWKKIPRKQKQKFALGIKEIWQVEKDLKKSIHTIGYPLSLKDFGGSFIYPMKENKVALGLVAGLDYKKADFDLYFAFEKFKKHALVQKILKNGKLLEWGAKSLPEGGYLSLAERFSGKNLLMSGDSLGLVNVPALKGIHYAIESGRLAAKSAYEKIIEKKDLSSYDLRLKNSYILKELYEVRNFKAFFSLGFFKGIFLSGISYLTKGKFPQKDYIQKADNEISKKNLFTDKNFPSKDSSVYFSKNKTRDDIKAHLDVKEELPLSLKKFYTRLCPAQVYELDENKNLIIKAPNCIDCKATDILGPRWSPREGGSGPNYSEM